eukprot:g4786.t1
MSSCVNFINNQFVDSQSTNTLDVTAPATGKHLGTVVLSCKADVDVAVSAAKHAHSSWSKLTTMKRAKFMYKFRELVQRDADELAKLIVEENGKNFAEARAEVAKGVETVEWACGMPHIMCGRRCQVSRGVVCHDIRDSLGVVTCVVPFNFPFMVPMWTVPIALTAGNCVILKPSEKVPLTMNKTCQLMKEAGLPDGVFQVVQGSQEAVTSLCDHDDVKALTFVGSSKVANIVYQRCSKLGKRVLALGGAKNHLVALEDCDSEGASSDIVASSFGCAGQRCMAASVLLLVGECKDVLDKVVDKANALQGGQEKGMVGPVIDAQSQKRIFGYIDGAEKRGAKVLVDGRKWKNTKKNGTWVGPTVLLFDSHDDDAVRDEIFGPVLSVVRVKSWQQAVDIENGSEYGNAASIYTSIGAHAEWFTARFRAGMIGVNIGVPVPREPFSFGGHSLTTSKFGTYDVTGDGAMEFFTTRRKVTSKWTKIVGRPVEEDKTDHANFAGQM